MGSDNEEDTKEEIEVGIGGQTQTSQRGNLPYSSSYKVSESPVEVQIKRNTQKKKPKKKVSKRRQGKD